MTQKETLAAIRALGMVASYDPEVSEYRVTWPIPSPRPAGATLAQLRERQEDFALYSPDPEDAYSSARVMAACTTPLRWIA